MTERLDEARKYVELFKMSVNNGDTEGSIMNGLRAVNILTVINETARNKEESNEAELLANEMLSSHYDSLEYCQLAQYNIERIEEDGQIIYLNKETRLPIHISKD